MKKPIPATRSRQGRLGQPVLVVLVVSLILAAFVWWAVEIYGEAIQTPATQDAPGNMSSETAPAD